MTWLEPRTFDVFEPDSIFLGTVVGPPQTELYLWKGDVVWGIEQGPSGEPYMVRLRIVTEE